jgi:hypothetical protein
MAELISQDDWLCWDGYDVSGLTQNMALDWKTDVKEWICFKAPTLGPSDPLTRRRIPGPEDWSMAVSGYLDFEVNYAAANASLAVNDAVVTRGLGRSLGSRVFLLQASMASFEVGGQVGEVIPFTGNLSGSNSVVVPGLLFEFGSKAATGNGTNQDLGAVAAGKNLYLHAHAVAMTGTPSFAVVYETSADGTYTDAVTRATFSAFAAVGRQRIVVAGPITDTHGRFRWTLTGSGTILFRFAAGIR